MLTPGDIIKRLQEDFSLRIEDQKVISMLNSLELRIALDILRKKKTAVFPLSRDADRIQIPGITEVSYVYINGKEIPKRRAAEPNGYYIENGAIVFESIRGACDVRVEYIETPEPISFENFKIYPLSLGKENEEVYIFHILSRVALMQDDIEKLNNYSILYANAMEKITVNRNACGSFKNIW